MRVIIYLNPLIAELVSVGFLSCVVLLFSGFSPMTEPALPSLQPYNTITVYEKCISFVEGTRCTNPSLPLTRHCVSRILHLPRE